MGVKSRVQQPADGSAIGLALHHPTTTTTISTMLFSDILLESQVSLFSSTSKDPLSVFSIHTDASHPEHSFIHFLHDTTCTPGPPAPAKLLPAPQHYRTQILTNESSEGYTLDQTVLHIQSPSLVKTYIRCPPTGGIPIPLTASNKTRELGLKSPWMHIQVRDLGKDWSFEVAVVDQSGKAGVIRYSTFQKEPRLKYSSSLGGPLLHLPLSFPQQSTSPLTPWCTVSVHFPTSMTGFVASTNRGHDHDSVSTSGSAITMGRFSHVSFVKVYANCRLRRIWFSQEPRSTNDPWEFELYSAM